jgi:uncharacterized membrane protein YfbV (UPF0208 family)
MQKKTLLVKKIYAIPETRLLRATQFTCARFMPFSIFPLTVSQLYFQQATGKYFLSGFVYSPI